MTRGLVVPLTPDQVVARALFLAGRVPIESLDEHVRKDHASLAAYGYPLRAGQATMCMPLYYLLNEHNGGKDPTAPDPGDRWTIPGSTFQNRTSDCVGGAAWCGGWDRYQPTRFDHLYDGWINTNSMRIDAGGAKRCFRRLKRPEPGCMVVFASGAGGHRVGHVGTVVAYHGLEWDASVEECWGLLDVVDVAARTPDRANKMTTGRVWRNADSWFVMSTMTP